MNIKAWIDKIKKEEKFLFIEFRSELRRELISVSVWVLFFFMLFSFYFNLFFKFQIDNSVEVKIPGGIGVKEISKMLEDDGLILNKFWFELYAFIRGDDARNLKAGRYVFGGKVSTQDIFNDLFNGKSIADDKKIKIFEGMNMVEIDERLSRNELITPGAFIAAAGDFDNSDRKYEFLPAEKHLNLEGYLFPDTYFLKDIKLIVDEHDADRPDSDQFSEKELALIRTEIIHRMLDQFREKIYLPYIVYLTSPDERHGNFSKYLIIASLLEKEAGNYLDMKLISGVIENRLRIGMNLQIDAALLYAKCFERAINSEGNPEVPDIANGYNCSYLLSSSDRQTESLFNVYIHSGLPPAPIANPGELAVEAAINPTPSRYFYYLSPGGGVTLFSETGEEHEAKRNIYLR